MNAKQLLIVAECKKLGKGEGKKFAALVAAIKAAWPNQEAVKGPEYAETSQAAQKAYVEAGGTKGGARYAWSVALSTAGLLAVKKDGTVMQKKGKTGAKAGAVKGTDNPAKPADLTDDACITHLFGHCDDALRVAVKVAAANEQAFLRFAQSIVEAASKKDGTLKKAA